VAERELARREHIARAIPQDVCRNSEGAPRETRILTVLAEVECSAHRLQIHPRSIVERSESREAAVLRLPSGQRTPERPHSGRSLRGHEPREPVGVHHAGVHSEPGHEHREHPEVVSFYRLDEREEKRVLDVRFDCGRCGEAHPDANR
jgi:hypothetical protein